jgi:hypothetical protein
VTLETFQTNVVLVGSGVLDFTFKIIESPRIVIPAGPTIVMFLQGAFDWAVRAKAKA